METSVTTFPRQDHPLELRSATRIAGAIARYALALAGAVALPAMAQSAPLPAGDAKAGRELFNQYCYHCHGTDAVQGERARDLRRLAKRYGDERAAIFRKTVSEGRLDKGMPAWTGTLSKEKLADVWAFLDTVQAQ
jgi:mono/diheme cytochrome c family protein